MRLGARAALRFPDHEDRVLRPVTCNNAAAVRSDRSGEILAVCPWQREFGIVLDHHMYPAEHGAVSSVDGCEQSSLSREILVKAGPTWI